MKKPKRIPIQNVVLRTAAAAGIVTISILAPRMTRVLKHLDKPARNRARMYQRLDQAVGRLEAAGLISVSGSSSHRKVFLTEKGREKADELMFDEYEIPEPAFWDGKWRVIAFDMSEKRRLTRTKLRFMLKHSGFVRLQDSVWIHPYPCEEFLQLVRSHLKIGTGELRYFVAEALESDALLRTHFKL